MAVKGHSHSMASFFRLFRSHFAHFCRLFVKLTNQLTICIIFPFGTRLQEAWPEAWLFPDQPTKKTSCCSIEVTVKPPHEQTRPAGRHNPAGQIKLSRSPARNRSNPGKQTICIHAALSCHINQPGQIPPGIQAVLNRRLNQTEDDRAALSAARRVSKEEVLPVDHEGLNTAFSTVVADLQPAIQEVVQQVGLLVFQMEAICPVAIRNGVPTRIRKYIK